MHWSLPYNVDGAIELASRQAGLQSHVTAILVFDEHGRWDPAFGDLIES